MSEKFVIIVDSTCDIDEELQKEYDIEILPGHFVAPDGKEYLSYPVRSDNRPLMYDWENSCFFCRKAHRPQ